MNTAHLFQSFMAAVGFCLAHQGEGWMIGAEPGVGWFVYQPTGV